jgi:hypothetical protein
MPCGSGNKNAVKFGLKQGKLPEEKQGKTRKETERIRISTLIREARSQEANKSAPATFGLPSVLRWKVVRSGQPGTTHPHAKPTKPTIHQPLRKVLHKTNSGSIRQPNSRTIVLTLCFSPNLKQKTIPTNPLHATAGRIIQGFPDTPRQILDGCRLNRMLGSEVSHCSCHLKFNLNSPTQLQIKSHIHHSAL